MAFKFYILTIGLMISSLSFAESKIEERSSTSFLYNGKPLIQTPKQKGQKLVKSAITCYSGGREVFSDSSHGKITINKDRIYTFINTLGNKIETSLECVVTSTP